MLKALKSEKKWP